MPVMMTTRGTTVSSEARRGDRGPGGGVGRLARRRRADLRGHGPDAAGRGQGAAGAGRAVPVPAHRRAQTWAVRFDGESVRLGPPGEPHDIQISGTASDLALFLWQRQLVGRLEVQGDTSLLSGYFVLVPPL